MLSLVESAGETEKVVQGLFDNYLEAKIKDARMVALNMAESWLVMHDLFTAKIQTTQNYVMMPYLYYTPVIFHLIFAMNHPPRIRYPNSQFDNYTKSTQNSQVEAMIRQTLNG
jgi:chromosome transmission fidelity protein 18